jgi:hypothetical protein
VRCRFPRPAAGRRRGTGLARDTRRRVQRGAADVELAFQPRGEAAPLHGEVVAEIEADRDVGRLGGLRLGHPRLVAPQPALGGFGRLAVLGGRAHHHIAAEAGCGLVGQDNDGAIGLEVAAHAELAVV